MRRLRAPASTAAIIALVVAAIPTLAAASEKVIEVYTRAGCLHCVEARQFLDELVGERPDLSIVERDVGGDPAALARLRQLTARAGIATPGVPSFVIGDAIVVGFDPETTPARVRSLLDGDRQTSGVVDLPLVGRLDVDRVGLPLFTVVIGLIDGFNPCAACVGF
jgi:glutaredoxin